MKYGTEITLIEDDHGTAMVTKAIYVQSIGNGKHIVRISTGPIVVDESVIYHNHKSMAPKTGFTYD